MTTYQETQYRDQVKHKHEDWAASDKMLPVWILLQLNIVDMSKRALSSLSLLSLPPSLPTSWWWKPGLCMLLPLTYIN